MSFETIVVERTGAVTLIRIDRPHTLNALNSQVCAELGEAMSDFDQDRSQGCAIVTGSDKAFAAGADIAEMQRLGFGDAYGDNLFSGFDRVTATRKPWIAAVAGFALGGGCELAMMADFIVAAENAKFGQPEIKLGVTPGMGGSQRLTRAIGKAKAMQMCLTGRLMDAREAEQAGLVATVTPLADLLTETMNIAAEISAMPRLASIANKEMVNAAFETTLSQGLLFERRLFDGICATEDKNEGMTAFLEKRQGRFVGR